MLTSRVVSVDIKGSSVQTAPALILVALVAGSLAGIFYSTWKSVPAASSAAVTTTPLLGTLLMTTYLLPFEVASVILLVTLLGAAFIARRKRKA
jgi:NADH-quinone oxidoreductase subunit J